MKDNQDSYASSYSQDNYYFAQDNGIMEYQISLTRIDLALQSGLIPLNMKILNIKGLAFFRLKEISSGVNKKFDNGGLLVLKLKEAIQRLKSAEQSFYQGQMQQVFTHIRLASFSKKYSSALKEHCAALWNELSKELQIKEQELKKMKAVEDQFQHEIKCNKDRMEDVRTQIKDCEKRINNWQAEYRKKNRGKLQKENSELKVRREQEQELRTFVQKMNVLLNDHQSKVQKYEQSKTRFLI